MTGGTGPMPPGVFRLPKWRKVAKVANFFRITPPGDLAPSGVKRTDYQTIILSTLVLDGGSPAFFRNGLGFNSTFLTDCR